MKKRSLSLISSDQPVLQFVGAIDPEDFVNRPVSAVAAQTFRRYHWQPSVLAVLNRVSNRALPASLSEPG